MRKAAEALHVSQPSISAQIGLLEDSLGQKLFKRSGRNLVIRETDRLVLTYADEIFPAGRELMNAVKQRPGVRALRLNVGITDALSRQVGDWTVGQSIAGADEVAASDGLGFTMVHSTEHAYSELFA